MDDVWPSSGLLHYIYIWGRGLVPLTVFYQVQNSLCIQHLHYLILVALLHRLEQWASTKLCGMISSSSRAVMLFHIGRSNCLVKYIKLLPYIMQYVTSIVFCHCMTAEQAFQYNAVNNCSRPIALQLFYPRYHFSLHSSRISHKFVSVKLNLTLM